MTIGTACFRLNKRHVVLCDAVIVSAVLPSEWAVYDIQTTLLFISRVNILNSNPPCIYTLFACEGSCALLQEGQNTWHDTDLTERHTNMFRVRIYVL